MFVLLCSFSSLCCKLIFIPCIVIFDLTMYWCLLGHCILLYAKIPKSEFSWIDNQLIDVVKALTSACFSFILSICLLTGNPLYLFWLIYLFPHYLSAINLSWSGFQLIWFTFIIARVIPVIVICSLYFSLVTFSSISYSECMYSSIGGAMFYQNSFFTLICNCWPGQYHCSLFSL